MEGPPSDRSCVSVEGRPIGLSYSRDSYTPPVLTAPPGGAGHSGIWALDVPGPAYPAFLLAPLRTSAPAPRPPPPLLPPRCLPPAAGTPAQYPCNFSILQDPTSSPSSILKRSPSHLACLLGPALFPLPLLCWQAPGPLTPWKPRLTTKKIQGPRLFLPSSSLISLSTLPWPWAPAMKGLDTEVQQVAHRLQLLCTNHWLLVYSREDKTWRCRAL